MSGFKVQYYVPDYCLVLKVQYYVPDYCLVLKVQYYVPDYCLVLKVQYYIPDYCLVLKVQYYVPDYCLVLKVQYYVPDYCLVLKVQYYVPDYCLVLKVQYYIPDYCLVLKVQYYVPDYCLVLKVQYYIPDYCLVLKVQYYIPDYCLVLKVQYYVPDYCLVLKVQYYIPDYCLVLKVQYYVPDYCLVLRRCRSFVGPPSSTGTDIVFWTLLVRVPLFQHPPRSRIHYPTTHPNSTYVTRVSRGSAVVVTSATSALVRPSRKFMLQKNFGQRKTSSQKSPRTLTSGVPNRSVFGLPSSVCRGAGLGHIKNALRDDPYMDDKTNVLVLASDLEDDKLDPGPPLPRGLPGPGACPG